MIRRTGQSTIEYAILIAMAAVAMAGMFGFIRNAVSHHYKVGADGFGHGLRY